MKGNQKSMDAYTFRKIKKEELPAIKSLWSALNDLHYRDSVYFKDHYAAFTFEKRISKFEAYDEDSIMIEIVENDGSIPVGYCIATLARDGVGEIDSLFIDAGHRDRGLGDRLLKSSIAWLRVHGCSRIRVAVAGGHESVFAFYRKYGFFPRMTFLETK